MPSEAPARTDGQNWGAPRTYGKVYRCAIEICLAARFNGLVCVKRLRLYAPTIYAFEHMAYSASKRSCHAIHPTPEHKTHYPHKLSHAELGAQLVFALMRPDGDALGHFVEHLRMDESR